MIIIIGIISRPCQINPAGGEWGGGLWPGWSTTDTPDDAVHYLQHTQHSIKGGKDPDC